MNIDIEDGDDHIQISDEPVEEIDVTTVADSEPVTVYGGEHHDYRGSTFNGPFVGKIVRKP